MNIVDECQHLETYYCIKRDNWYCKNCDKGMGTSYQYHRIKDLEKQVEILQKKFAELESNASVAQMDRAIVS